MAQKTRVKRLQEELFRIYRDLYKKATPKEDFDKLFEKYASEKRDSGTGDDGARNVFSDHVINVNEYNKILDKHFSKKWLKDNEKNVLKYLITSDGFCPLIIYPVEDNNPDTTHKITEQKDVK